LLRLTSTSVAPWNGSDEAPLLTAGRGAATREAVLELRDQLWSGATAGGEGGIRKRNLNGCPSAVTVRAVGEENVQVQAALPSRWRRLLRRAGIGLVALVSPSIGFLLAGLPVSWAVLVFIQPLLDVATYAALPDHPRALAVAALAGALLTILVSLASSILAFWFAGREARCRRARGALLGLVACFVLASVLANFTMEELRRARLEPFRIPSGGMLPTLIPGDQFLVDKRRLTPASPGDVVVFRPPGEHHQETHVKRVIAVAGDTVEIRGDEVWVNGNELAHVALAPGEGCSAQTPEVTHGYCVREVLRPDRSYQLLLIDRPAGPFGPRTLKSGELFVLGDNRNNSYDSRHFGPIHEDQVMGRAIVVWLSWWEWRPRLSRIGLKP